MATNETFADRLTKLRENTGKKRQEVADELKISRASLEYYEKSKRKPDTEVLVKIAEYYEVSTDYLLGLSIAPTTNKDIQFICDYTGLSEEVIEELNEIKLCATQGYICKTPINKNLIENNPDFVETSKKEETQRLDTISKFISNGSNPNMLNIITSLMVYFDEFNEDLTAYQSVNEKAKSINNFEEKSLTELYREVAELGVRDDKREFMLYRMGKDFESVLDCFVKDKENEIKKIQDELRTIIINAENKVNKECFEKMKQLKGGD